MTIKAYEQLTTYWKRQGVSPDEVEEGVEKDYALYIEACKDQGTFEQAMDGDYDIDSSFTWSGTKQGHEYWRVRQR